MTGKCGQTTATLVIGITNFIIMIFSILLFFAGGLLYFFPVNDLLESFESEAKTKMAGISESRYSTVSTAYINDWHITDSVMFGKVCLGMLLGGALLIAYSLTAFLGAACKVRPALLVYGVILCLIVLFQVLYIGILYTDNDMVFSSFQKGLEETLKTYKGEFYPSNNLTLSWNFAMIYFECCGISDYQDFSSNSPEWKTQADGISVVMPIFCCNPVPSTFTTCSSTPSGNYQKGCYVKAEDKVHGNSTVFMLGYVASLIFQIALIVFTFMLFTSTAKNKVEDSNEDTDDGIPRKY